MIQSNNLPKPFNKKQYETQIEDICNRNDIALLAIFGSFARGEQNKKSDIDLAIEFKNNAKKSLFDLVHLEFEMQKVFKRKVDLGLFRSINPHVINYVKKDMKIIYEKR